MFSRHTHSGFTSSALHLRACRTYAPRPPLNVSFYMPPSLPPEDRGSPTLRQARSALRPLSPTHLTLLLLAAWLGGCAADGSPPLSPTSPPSPPSLPPSSPPAPPSPSMSPPLSSPPLSPAWDISVSGCYNTALGNPKALNYIFQGTTASGAPYYKAESDDGRFYYLYLTGTPAFGSNVTTAP